ncbi:hypothetical protein DWY60_02175 [Bifidobacterium pseudocatenulatum]|nr:hypothetical protein DWY60_02175 [Bifidobacterium pseudocatenulatum]
MQGVTDAAQSAFGPMTLRSAIGLDDLATIITEIRGLRSDLQSLHEDLGPTIGKYAPTMSLREWKRAFNII